MNSRKYTNEIFFFFSKDNSIFISFNFSRLIHCTSFFTFRYISSTFRSITNHLEKGNVETHYLLYLKALLNCCGDIEINPGPKQLSLIIWIISEIWMTLLLLMTSLKFHRYRAVLQIVISTLYVCLKLSLILLFIEMI